MSPCTDDALLALRVEVEYPKSSTIRVVVAHGRRGQIESTVFFNVTNRKHWRRYISGSSRRSAGPVHVTNAQSPHTHRIHGRKAGPLNARCKWRDRTGPPKFRPPPQKKNSHAKVLVLALYSLCIVRAVPMQTPLVEFKSSIYCVLLM